MLAVLKPTPLLPHEKMLLVLILFFLASRLCSRGPVLYFDLATVIVAACFTLRGHDTLTVNLLLGPPEDLFISSPFEGGLNRDVGLI